MEHSEVVARPQLFPQELQISLAVMGTHLSGMLFLGGLWAPRSTRGLWTGGMV